MALTVWSRNPSRLCRTASSDPAGGRESALVIVIKLSSQQIQGTEEKTISLSFDN